MSTIAAMMPGHEDREDELIVDVRRPRKAGRNDARSRRPGRRGCDGDGRDEMGGAAMMPGHEDREDT